MKKLFSLLDNLLHKIRFNKMKSRSKSVQHKKHPIYFEPLESRNLLTILYWLGNSYPNSPQVWDTSSPNWTTNGIDHVTFSNTNGDDVIFGEYDAPLNVQISGNVQPKSIEFSKTGFSITGGSISAFESTLTVTVNQTGLTPESLATISAPITGSNTKLVVAGNIFTNPSTHILYPSGTLKLTGNNDYGGGTEITDHMATIGGVISTSGGVLLAGNPNALPRDGSVYRNITVEPSATLAVETGTAGEWDTPAISTLLNNSNPDSNPNFEAASNFGISVDYGTSFEYSGTIPGNSENRTHNNENFVKLDVGTLTLSGENTYPGSTTIKNGTLLATTPTSLPTNNGSYQPITAMSIGDHPLQGYGYHGVEHDFDGTQDPHSMLAVQCGVGGGWNAEQITTLLTCVDEDTLPISGAHFQTNTNFGIKVDDGTEFDFSEQSFKLGRFDISVPDSVGFVKLGKGTLVFGTNAGNEYFAGPFSIHEGMLRASPGCKTFPDQNKYTDLYINNYATFDLNIVNSAISPTGYTTWNCVARLFGESQANITDNSILYPSGLSDMRNCLSIPTYNSSERLSSVYAGNFTQGKYGTYPSLSLSYPESVVLKGNTIVLWNFFCDNLSNVVIMNTDGNQRCDMTVKNIMSIQGNFTWESTGTLTANFIQLYNSNGIAGIVTQTRGTILITPSGESFVVPSQALFFSLWDINGINATKLPEFHLVNSSLILATQNADINSGGTKIDNSQCKGVMNVSYGTLQVENSTVKIGSSITLDNNSSYECLGELRVDHGLIDIKNNSKVEINSSPEKFWERSNITLNGDGILKTASPIYFRSYNYASLGSGYSNDASYFNAEFIFVGGTLVVDTAFPASNPVFVYKTDYAIDLNHVFESGIYSQTYFSSPHLYILPSEPGKLNINDKANIATNNPNVKITLPIEHNYFYHSNENGSQITYAEYGLSINPDTDMNLNGTTKESDETTPDPSEQFTGTVTLCVDESIYTDDKTEYQKKPDKLIFYTRYHGDTKINNGELFLGDGTQYHNGSVRWRDWDNNSVIHYSDITNNASLVFYNYNDQQFDGIISGSGSVTKSGSGDLTLGSVGDNANNYLGGTILNATLKKKLNPTDNPTYGTLILGKNSALGDATGRLTIDCGNLDLNGNSIRVSSLSGDGGSIYSSPLILVPPSLYSTNSSVYRGTVEDTVTLQNVTISNSTEKAKVINVTIDSPYNSAHTYTVYDSNSSVESDTHEIIYIIVNYNRLVTVTGKPHLLLNSGLSDATYASGSGTSALVFEHRIEWGEDAKNLDYSSTAALIVQVGTTVGTIWDSETNQSASLTLKDPGTPYSLANCNVTIDTHLYWSGEGYWDTGNENWLLGGPLSETHVAWSNNRDAVFSANLIPNTCSIGSAEISPHSITFEREAFNLYAAPSCHLAIAYDTTIYVNCNKATIASPIQGTNKLTKLGDGTLILGADNSSYTGTTTISSGTLQLGESGQAFSQIGGSIENNSRLAFYCFNEPEIDFNNTISGSGLVDMTGDGTITLSGANTYKGGTIIEEGTLKAGANSTSTTSPFGLGGVFLYENGNLDINSHSITVTSLAGHGAVYGGGALTINTQSSTSSIYYGKLGFNPVNSQIYNLALTKDGLGAQILAGVNYYTAGTTIKAGILGIFDDHSLGTAPGTTATNITFNGNGTLQAYAGLTLGTTRRINIAMGKTATIDTQSYLVTIGGTIIGSGNLKKTSAGILDLNGNTTSTLNTVTLVNGTIRNGTLNASSAYQVQSGTISAVLNGSGSLTKSTMGTVILSGTNTYSGGTTISGGVLNISDDHALGDPPSTITTNISFSGDGTLQAGAGFNLGAMRKINIATGKTATIDTQGYTMTIAGVIGGSTGALTKTGFGTLTLSNSNLSLGTVTCQQGTLTINTLTCDSLTIGQTLGSSGYSAHVSAMVNGTSDGLTYALIDPPSGMSIDSTGHITWTPDEGQTMAGTEVVAVVSDAFGHSSQISFVINHAPVLESVNEEPAIGPTIGHTLEDSPFTTDIGSFINNGTGTTAISDSDSGDVVGGIAITFAQGYGTWEYSLDGIEFEQFSPIQSSGTSLLLPNYAQLRYTPDGSRSESAIITYRAWDMTYGASGDYVDLSSASSHGGITAFSEGYDSAQLFVNNAPVLTAANPILGITNDETVFTIPLINSFINHGTGTTIIVDANTNATVGGIAIIGITGNGTWEYKPLISSGFLPIGSVSLASALILSKNATQLRYTPDGENAETATITYIAWDNTFSANDKRVDLSQTGSIGGTTAFSTDSDTATLTVTAVHPRLYWDPAGVSGGDGIWDTDSADTYWHLGSPTGALTAWIEGANAVFGNCGDTPGQITIADSNNPGGPISVRSITFAEGGYSLVGLTDNDTLSIVSSGMKIDVNEGSATIACKLVDAAFSEGGLAKTGDGILTLNGANTYTGNTTVNGGELRFDSGAGNTPLIDIEAGKAVFANVDVFKPELDIRTGADGTFEIADDIDVTVRDITGPEAGLPDDAGTTLVSDGGHLTARKIFQDALTLDANSTAILTVSASSLELRVFVNQLNLQATSTLDINDAGMIITDGIYTDVVSRIRQGLNEANSGWWDGAGITSSVAKNDANTLICLGILTGEEYLENSSSAPLFLGTNVTGHSNWILIRPTVLGDSDYDSATTDLDYGYINYFYGGGDIPAATWMWGDYNYDGLIDATDYAYIDYAYSSAAQYQG